MDLRDLLVPTYVQMLGALSSWLDKAATQMPGEAGDALMAARLAPDMFPLATQARFACVQSLEGVARLKGEAYPPAVATLLAEGRAAGEHPGTIADARAVIAETIAAVEAAAADLSGGDPDRAIEHALPIGITFDFTAAEYARDWSLSQFYFHVMTAYAILRNQGVALGKADYVGHLGRFVRPGTMPAA